MDTATLAAAVMAEAERHYTEGGWDVLVECWDEEGLTEFWSTLPTFPTTEAEAIESVRPLVAIWADRQADARNSAF